MSFFDAFLPVEFTRAFSLTLLHSLWQGALIALVALLLMIYLRRQSPGLRYSVLFGLLTLIPVLFVITFFIVYQPSIEVPHETATISGPMAAIPDGPDKAQNNLSSIHSWYNSFSDLINNNAHWLFVFWFTGFLFFLLRFTGSLLYIQRLKSYRLKECPALWKDRMASISRKIGLSTPVRLAESALVKVPVSIGYLKPVILLPLGTLSGVPPQQIDAILSHELAHILRKDYLLNIFQSVIELLFFYHPVTWWLSGLIRQEREHICDDIALNIHPDRINYIKALTTMEKLNFKSPFLASAWIGNRKKLLYRVKRLVSPDTTTRGLTEGIAASILLVSLILAFSANALNFSPATVNSMNENEDLKIRVLVPSYYLTSPDSITAKSQSGRVVVKVYTDTVNPTDEEMLQDMVEQWDARVSKWERSREDFDKQMYIMQSKAGKLDSLRKVVVIKDGDTMIVRAPNIEMKYPHRAYYFHDFHDIPNIEHMPEFRNLYFDEKEFEKLNREMFKNQREMEFQWKEFDRQKELMDKQSRDMRVFVNPPDLEQEHEWVVKYPGQPYKKSEKIIRQELRSDGLALPGKKYVIELDSKSMYINGVKQSKDNYRKYKRLVESLEAMKLEGDEFFKLIF